MSNLYLIYIHQVGMDWKERNIYEFIFSESTEDIDGEEWDAIPAAGRPSAPYEEHVQKVGVLTTGEFSLHLIQESDTFSVWDSIDGAVALAWENMDEYEEYPEKRLAFHFGEEIKSVEEKLYEHDLILDYKKTTNVKLKENDTE